jgi:hypothetical protein
MPARELIQSARSRFAGRVSYDNNRTPAYICARIERANANEVSGDAILVYVVDLVCLQCGRLVGELDAPRWPWYGHTLFRHSRDAPPVQVANWRQLRCRACGGKPCPEEFEIKRKYPALSREDLVEPRRGRPPKWLVEQRRKQLDGDAE